MLNTAGVTQIAQGLGHVGGDKRAFAPLISPVCPWTSALHEEVGAGGGSSPARTGDYFPFSFGMDFPFLGQLFIFFPLFAAWGKLSGHWNRLPKEMVMTPRLPLQGILTNVQGMFNQCSHAQRGILGVSQAARSWAP